MKKLLLLLALNSCCITLFAQRADAYKTRDSLIEKSIDNLHAKGIDTIAVYSYYSSVVMLPNCRSDQFPNYDSKKYDPCSSTETFLVFILWKKDSQSFFTFKTQCYDYPVKTVQDNSFWTYYATNRAAIENSKPKEPLLKHVNLQTEEITIGPDKMSYRETPSILLMMLAGNTKTTRSLGYRLFQQFGNMGDQNLNYEYNMNLPDKQLQLKLEALCKPLVVSRELTIAAKN